MRSKQLRLVCYKKGSLWSVHIFTRPGEQYYPWNLLADTVPSKLPPPSCSKDPASRIFHVEPFPQLKSGSELLLVFSIQFFQPSNCPTN
jgi:hypothetical protein